MGDDRGRTVDSRLWLATDVDMPTAAHRLLRHYWRCLCSSCSLLSASSDARGYTYGRAAAGRPRDARYRSTSVDQRPGYPGSQWPLSGTLPMRSNVSLPPRLV